MSNNQQSTTNNKYLLEIHGVVDPMQMIGVLQLLCMCYNAAPHKGACRKSSLGGFHLLVVLIMQKESDLLSAAVEGDKIVYSGLLPELDKIKHKESLFKGSTAYYGLPDDAARRIANIKRLTRDWKRLRF